MKLLEGEKILLECPGRAVTLTNTRLVFQKKKGLFNPYFMVEEEILLEQIEEAYTHTEGGLTQSSSAKLRMKNGEMRDLNVSFGGGDGLASLFAAGMATDMALRSKTASDKWVNAINQQLRAKVEDRTKKLEDKIRGVRGKAERKVKIKNMYARL